MTGTMVAVANSRRKTERIAPCGAELATGGRRLRGAVLYRRIEVQLRSDYLAPFGLPLAEYACQVERDEGGTLSGWFTSRSLESLTATFTHLKTGARVVVTGIWVKDSGEIVQCGTQYGDLTL